MYCVVAQKGLYSFASGRALSAEGEAVLFFDEMEKDGVESGDYCETNDQKRMRRQFSKPGKGGASAGLHVRQVPVLPDWT